MYSQSTESLKVTVIPKYQDDLSSPYENYYVWSYSIYIENNSEVTVKLSSRYWRIIDANGKVQEINGPGVIGQQPILRPGEAFEYTSHAQLKTSSGIMEGNYTMLLVDKENREIEIKIPTFSLDNPYEIMNLN
jgi:ApaG protein